jgi:hypothetical protein
VRAVIEQATQWNPTFHDRVRGASREAIRELEQFVRIPDDWRDFLETMGESAGGLLPQGDFRMSRVLPMYRQVERRTERFLFVGFSADADEFVHNDFYLDLTTTPAMVLQTEVTDASDDHHHTYTAGSLAELWMAAAFVDLRLEPFAEHALLIPNGSHGWSPAHRSHSTHLDPVVMGLGFDPVAAEQVILRCFDRPDAAITAFQPPGYATQYRIGSDDRLVLRELAQTLCRELHLVAQWR